MCTSVHAGGITRRRMRSNAAALVSGRPFNPVYLKRPGLPVRSHHLSSIALPDDHSYGPDDIPHRKNDSIITSIPHAISPSPSSVVVGVHTEEGDGEMQLMGMQGM